MTLFSIVHLLPNGILLSPLTWPLLSSNLAFLHEYLLALLQAQSLAYSPACCTGIHMGTGARICEKLSGNVEKMQALKVRRRPAQYKLFWSTASSLFIETSKLFLVLFCCRDELCPWACSAFKFPAVCEHGWASSQHSPRDSRALGTPHTDAAVTQL